MQKRGNAAWIIIVAAVVLVLVVGVFFWYHLEKKKEQERQDELALEAQVAWLKMGKCMSLCPLEEYEQYELDTPIENFTLVEPSCSVNCMSLTDVITEEQNRAYLDSGMEIVGNLFVPCFYDLRKDSEFDFVGCLDNVIDEYSDVIDLSDFTLPEYVVYSYGIINYSCEQGKTTIEIKLHEGDSAQKKFNFGLEDEQSTTRIVELDASDQEIGETKTYEISHEDQGIDLNIVGIEVGLFVKINDKWRRFGVKKRFC